MYMLTAIPIVAFLRPPTPSAGIPRTNAHRSPRPYRTGCCCNSSGDRLYRHQPHHQDKDLRGLFGSASNLNCSRTPDLSGRSSCPVWNLAKNVLISIGDSTSQASRPAESTMAGVTKQVERALVSALAKELPRSPAEMSRQERRLVQAGLPAKRRRPCCSTVLMLPSWRSPVPISRLWISLPSTRHLLRAFTLSGSCNSGLVAAKSYRQETGGHPVRTARRHGSRCHRGRGRTWIRPGSIACWR